MKKNILNITFSILGLLFSASALAQNAFEKMTESVQVSSLVPLPQIAPEVLVTPTILRLNFERDRVLIEDKIRTELGEPALTQVKNLVITMSRSISEIDDPTKLNDLYCRPIQLSYRLDSRTDNGKIAIGNFAFSIVPCTIPSRIAGNSVPYLGSGQSNNPYVLKGFVVHFYKLFQKSPSKLDDAFRSWFSFRLTDFYYIMLKSNQDIRSPISQQAAISYFEKIFQDLSGGTVDFVEKTRVTVAPAYDEKNHGYSFFKTFNDAGTELNTFPEVISTITGAGEHVVYDNSGFAVNFGGEFSYAWQILFHADINKDFLNHYNKDLASFGENPAWYAWLNFLAGKGPETSLRTTQFFGRAFEQVKISPR